MCLPIPFLPKRDILTKYLSCQLLQIYTCIKYTCVKFHTMTLHVVQNIPMRQQKIAKYYVRPKIAWTATLSSECNIGFSLVSM